MSSELTIDEFCSKHNACCSGKSWAKYACGTMLDVWSMAQPHILLWVVTRPGVLPVWQLGELLTWVLEQTRSCVAYQYEQQLCDQLLKLAHVTMTHESDHSKVIEPVFNETDHAVRSIIRDATRPGAETQLLGWLHMIPTLGHPSLCPQGCQAIPDSYLPIALGDAIRFLLGRQALSHLSGPTDAIGELLMQQHLCGMRAETVVLGVTTAFHRQMDSWDELAVRIRQFTPNFASDR